MTDQDDDADTIEVGDTIDVAGLPVRVASREECEACDFAVCVTAEVPSRFLDNIVTLCADCHRPIQHRPHAPVKPPKICVFCFLTRTATKH